MEEAILRLKSIPKSCHSCVLHSDTLEYSQDGRRIGNSHAYCKHGCDFTGDHSVEDYVVTRAPFCPLEIGEVSEVKYRRGSNEWKIIHLVLD